MSTSDDVITLPFCRAVTVYCTCIQRSPPLDLHSSSVSLSSYVRMSTIESHVLPWPPLEFQELSSSSAVEILMLSPSAPGGSPSPPLSEVFMHIDVWLDRSDVRDTLLSSSSDPSSPEFLLSSTRQSLGGKGALHFTVGRRHLHAPPVLEWLVEQGSLVEPGQVCVVRCPRWLSRPRNSEDELETETVLVRAELGNVHPYYYVTPDGCVRRRVLEEGEGRGSPNPGAVVCVRVGDGGPARSWSTVVEGGGEEEEWLEEAVLKMKRGELALIETRGGEFGERLDKVHLVEFQEFKNVWELDQEEKLMFAESRKLQGNECYRLGKLERATRRYEQSLDFLQYEQDTWSTDERKERARELKVALFSNLAAIYLAKENVKEVIHYASEALALDPMSVKARFRRAKGYFLGGHSESAIQDVDYLLENCHLDDKVRSSACSIKSLSQKKLRESKSEQLKMFGGIFERRI